MKERMLKKKWFFYLGLIALIACKNDEPTEPPVAVDNAINEFVWGGLNSWYYWQQQVSDLSDNRFETLSEKNQFLNQYTDPSTLFDDLMYTGDRFSWIVDDYIELQNRFQGVSRSYGFEFNLINIQGTDSVLGYTTYVLPNTDAASRGIVRGDVFYAIDDTRLTLTNYAELINQETIKLAYANRVNGSWTDNGKTVSLDAVQIAENPVHLAKVLEVEGTKVGYIMYNQFVHTRHRELNAAFGLLKNDGVTELVLDLRYNTGGSVFTALLLGGMIYNQGTETTLFSKLIYNPKHANNNFDFPFLTELAVLNADFEIIASEVMNRLNLSRVYILTGRNTASASEIIINGLEPYMEVIQIGTYTRGKNEGSVTLYDSPYSDYRDVSTANPDHLWAMQPIVSKIANADGFGAYENGLAPDYEIDEVSFYYDLKPLGDPDEQLLKIALDDISGLNSIGRLATFSSDAVYLGTSTHKEKFTRSSWLDGLDIR